MKGAQGFTLIEVVIVLAIIAISLSMAGPRIGAGIGRIELNQAEQTVRTFIKFARLEAQRADRGQYVVLEREAHLVSVVGPEMEAKRTAKIPDSVVIVLADDARVGSLYVPPSGILRGQSVILRGRSGEVEIASK